MTASKYIVIPILTCLLLLIDWYVWQAVKIVFQHNTAQVQQFVKWAFWSLTAIIIFGLWLYNFAPPDALGRRLRTAILFSLFAVYGSKLLSVTLIFLGDAARFFTWAKGQFFPNNELPQALSESPDTITRSEFLMKTALVAASVPAAALTWGILSGAHDYRVRRVKLAIKNLPRSFEGMTIGQISDIHSGSFFNKIAVKGGIELLLKEKPDMVFFTGDLVNDRATEVNDYVHLFDKIKAPLGVYSTLGNHDYGAYAGWPSPQAKKQNLDDVKKAHKVLGYDLLTDDRRTIQLGGEKLAIIGVENISANESIFPNNGNLQRAIVGTEEAAVKLLLSHDPTHWDMEVNTQYPDIDVMFSGHTHGLQLGVTIGDKTYSPAQWQYKQWGGLYQKGNQQLYVNRGFGYLGFPGRVGMPPEITIFELASA